MDRMASATRHKRFSKETKPYRMRSISKAADNKRKRTSKHNSTGYRHSIFEDPEYIGRSQSAPGLRFVPSEDQSLTVADTIVETQDERSIHLEDTLLENARAAEIYIEVTNPKSEWVEVTSRSDSEASLIEDVASARHFHFRDAVRSGKKALRSYSSAILIKAHTHISLDGILANIHKDNTHKDDKQVIQQNSNSEELVSTKFNPRTAARTIDSETPAPKLPSCSGLPMGWTKEHDRFIAYLATHAPLDKNGNPQKDIDFYTNAEISLMIGQKFDKFRKFRVPEWAIEKRLDTLDLLENTYFGVEYGAFAETWGHDI